MDKKKRHTNKNGQTVRDRQIWEDRERQTDIKGQKESEEIFLTVDVGVLIFFFILILAPSVPK